MRVSKSTALRLASYGLVAMVGLSGAAVATATQSQASGAYYGYDQTKTQCDANGVYFEHHAGFRTHQCQANHHKNADGAPLYNLYMIF